MRQYSVLATWRQSSTERAAVWVSMLSKCPQQEMDCPSDSAVHLVTYAVLAYIFNKRSMKQLCDLLRDPFFLRPSVAVVT